MSREKADVTRLADGSLIVKPPPAEISLTALMAKGGKIDAQAFLAKLKKLGIKLTFTPDARKMLEELQEDG